MGRELKERERKKGNGRGERGEEGRVRKREPYYNGGLQAP